MTATRRTALAMLGLGSTTAVGAETFMAPPDKPGDIRSVSSAYNRERVASAFEQLAAELRQDRVEFFRLNLSASMEPDSLADVHELTVKFLYKPEV